MANVIEIAVRRVRQGKEAAFRSRRAEFITILKRQPGVSADREFSSFHAIPTPDTAEVFIGMTEYNDLAAVARVQRQFGVLWRFLRFSRTMDLKAYLFAEQTEGPEIDLVSLAAADGQVLEVAVRRVTDRSGFDTARKRFVDLLSKQEGVLQSYELSPVKGKNVEDLKVGLTVYESMESFEAAARALMSHRIAEEYFSTFEPVAVQYAFSTSNT